MRPCRESKAVEGATPVSPFVSQRRQAPFEMAALELCPGAMTQGCVMMACASESTLPTVLFRVPGGGGGDVTDVFVYPSQGSAPFPRTLFVQV